MFVVSVVFCDELTSNEVPFRVVSCNPSFIFDRPIICKTDTHIEPDVTPYDMSLDVDVSTPQKYN